MTTELSFLDRLVEELLKSKHNNYSEECISIPNFIQISISMMSYIPSRISPKFRIVVMSTLSAP
jgi:hypothetical protein